MVFGEEVMGLGSDRGSAIAVGESGRAYVPWYTLEGSTPDSNDYPTTPGAFDTTSPDFTDPFVTKQPTG